MTNTQKCRTCGDIIPAGRKKYCDKHPSEKASTQRLKASERTTLGICRFCKEPICEGSKVFCEKHLIANRERSLADRQRRKEEGLCRVCNEPRAVDSNTWCEFHRDKQNEASREFARQNRETELCIDCNKVPREKRKQRCQACHNTWLLVRPKFCRRLGCEEPAELKYFCRPHADEENEKLKQRRKQLKADNQCIFCFNKITDSSKNDAPHVLCIGCREKQKEQRRTVAA